MGWLFCDFDRNYGFGDVSGEALDAYELLWQATEDAITRLKPGMTSADLFGIMQPAWGQPMMMLAVMTWIGDSLTEPPSHIGWDDTVLTENMVLTLEPSLALSGGKMMVHEENILMTADGAELLSTRRTAMPIIK